MKCRCSHPLQTKNARTKSSWLFHIWYLFTLTVIDLEDRLISIINSDYLDTFSLGESKVACSFTLDECNALIKSALPEFINSRFTCELTNNVAYIKIKDIYASFMVDEIIYMIVVDISGYEVDFDIATVLCESSPGFTFYSLLDLNATSGGATFSRYSECYSLCSSYLIDKLKSLDKTYEYFHYQDTNLLFYMDFGYIIDQIDAFTVRFAFELLLNNITSSSFDFVVTRLI